MPYSKTTGFAPGECPHALVTWLPYRDMRSPIDAYHPMQQRCVEDHRREPSHVTSSGQRWL